MKNSLRICFLFSAILNIILFSIVLMSVLGNTDSFMEFIGLVTKDSYLSNPRYMAQLSVFELNNRDAEVIFAGDSLTENGRFDEFFPGFNILNRGIGGDMAEGVYNRLDEILSHNPQKIFIMVGINDLSVRIPVEKSIDYYDMILDQIQQEHSDCEIFVESLLPARTVKTDLVEKYNDSLKSVCKRHNIEYIDIFSSFVDNEGIYDDLYSEDGVHLNGNGYKIWIDIIKDYLIK